MTQTKRLSPTGTLASLVVAAATHFAQAAPHDLAYVSNRADDTVTVFAIDDARPIVTIPVGDGPTGVAVLPDGTRAYVANTLAGTVSIIDTALQTVVTNLPVGLEPGSIVVSRDGSRVYVANAGSASISVLSGQSNVVLRTMATATAPSALAWHPVRDELWIGFNGTAGVEVRSGSDDGVLATLRVSGGRFYASNGLTLSPDGNVAYGTEGCGCCGRFHRLSGNPTNGTIAVLQTDLYENAGYAIGVSVDRQTGRAYFAQQGHCSTPKRPRIVELGGQGRELVLPDLPRGTAIDPDGQRLYVAMGNVVRILDLATFTMLADVPTGTQAQQIALRIGTPSRTPSLIRNGGFEFPTLAENSIQRPIVPTLWTGGNDAAVINGQYGPAYPLPHGGRQYGVIGYRTTLAQSFVVDGSGNYSLAWFDSTEFNGPAHRAPYDVVITKDPDRELARGRFDANASALGAWAERSLEFRLDPGTYRVEFISLAEQFGAKPLIDDVTLLPDLDLSTSIRVASVRIEWPGYVHRTYQVQYKESVGGEWLNLGSPVQGTGNNSVVDDNLAATHRIYRVTRQP